MCKPGGVVVTAMVAAGHAWELLEQADARRVAATRTLDAGSRAALGQYLTGPKLAHFMASMFERWGSRARILEAGAGVGMLVAAAVARGLECGATDIAVGAFEVDRMLARHLRETLATCGRACRRAQAKFRADLSEQDFIEGACRDMRPRFTHAILNPPYKKIHSGSAARRCLMDAGIDASNLYAAFVALAISLLEPGGELVAITPRSFCNGPYFRAFRELLLRETALRRVHLFESRTAAFADDGVLQENVVFHLVKGRPQGAVLVSSSCGPEGAERAREVPFEQVVRPGDAARFIHLAPNDRGQDIADMAAALPASLEDLRLSVSTGKVVDFRAKAFLRAAPEYGACPLIYPSHFSNGEIVWPRAGKKPNALVDAPETRALWMPRGRYVLVKRFSSKEEPRRVVAAVFSPLRLRGVDFDKVGFENHLNVFHAGGAGLDAALARGLAAFLNSDFVDAYFRQFSGHTQVNAADLRSLRYPAAAALRGLGTRRGAAVGGAIR